MKKQTYVISRAIAVALLLVPFLAGQSATAAEQSAVTLKVSRPQLNSLPDKHVDDLCRAARVIWNYLPTRENADAMSAICAVSLTRRQAAGKTPVVLEDFPLQK